MNPQGKDNYLAAKDLYLVANDLEKKFPQSVSMLEVLFRSYPYRSQLSYPDALQREGTFDDVSRTGGRRPTTSGWTSSARRSSTAPADNITWK